MLNTKAISSLYKAVTDAGLISGMNESDFTESMATPKARKSFYDLVNTSGKLKLGDSYEDFDLSLAGKEEASPYKPPETMAVMSKEVVVTPKGNSSREFSTRNNQSPLVTSKFQDTFKDIPEMQSYLDLKDEKGNYAVKDFSDLPKIYKSDPQTYFKAIKKIKSGTPEEQSVYQSIKDQPIISDEEKEQSRYLKDLSNAFHESVGINPVGAAVRDFNIGASESVKGLLDGIDLMARNTDKSQTAVSRMAGSIADRIDEYNKSDINQFHGIDEVSKFISGSVQGVGSSAPFLFPAMATARIASAIGYSKFAAKALGVMINALPESASEAGNVFREFGKSDRSFSAAYSDLAMNLVLLPVTDYFSGLFDVGETAKASAIKKMLMYPKSIAMEASQEGLQQMASNTATGRPLMEGVQESATQSILTTLLALPSVTVNNSEEIRQANRAAVKETLIPQMYGEQIRNIALMPVSDSEKETMYTKMNDAFNKPEVQEKLVDNFEKVKKVNDIIAQAIDESKAVVMKIPDAASPQEFYEATFPGNPNGAMKKVESTDDFIKIKNEVSKKFPNSSEEVINMMSHIAYLGAPESMTDNFTKEYFNGLPHGDIMSVKAEDVLESKAIEQDIATSPVKPEDGYDIAYYDEMHNIDPGEIAENKYADNLERINTVGPGKEKDIEIKQPEITEDNPFGLDYAEETGAEKEFDPEDLYQEKGSFPLEEGRFVKYQGKDYVVTKKNEDGTLNIYTPAGAGKTLTSVSPEEIEGTKFTGNVVDFNNQKFMVMRDGGIIDFKQNRKVTWAKDDPRRIQIASLVNKVSPPAPNEATGQNTAPAQPQFRTLSEIKADMESRKVHEESLKPVFDFVMSKMSGDTPVKYINNKTKVNGIPAGQLKTNAIFNRATNEIYINTDRTDFNDPKAYRTIMHEAVHASLNKALDNDIKFRHEITRLSDEFRAAASSDEKFVQNHQDEFDGIYKDGKKTPYEFLAYAMTNNDISAFMKQTPIGNKSVFSRLVDLAKRFITEKMHGKPVPATMWDDFVQVMHENTGMPSDINATDFLKEKVNENIIDSMGEIEKDELLNPEAQTDRSAAIVARMLSESEGVQGNPVKYVQSLTKEQFKEKIMNLDDWTRRTEYHYRMNYIDKMPFPEYRDRVCTSVYNYIKNLVQNTTYRIDKGRVTDLGENWTGEKGEQKTNWHSRMRLEEYLPELEKIFGVKFELCHLEKAIVQNEDGSEQWVDINSSRGFKNRNEEVSQILEDNGLIFLGTWADKNTSVCLRPSEKLPVAVKSQLVGKYTELINNLCDGLSEGATEEMKEALGIYRQADTPAIARTQVLKDFNVPEEVQVNFVKNYGGDIFTSLQFNEQELDQLGINPNDYNVYLNSKKIPDGMLLRIMLHDLRFGGDPIGQSALFDIKNKDSYNAIKIFKRPDLISPMYKAYYSPEEAIATLKDMPEEFGIESRDGKITVTGMIIDDSPKEGTTPIDGKEYNLTDLFINSMGTERGDGVCVYVDGGFNKVYQSLHGVLKDGVIKAAITNSFGNIPLFCKMSVQKVSPESPLGKYLLTNKTTVAVFGSAAKISGYQKTTYGQDADKFKIPFEDFQRQSEKAGVKDGVKGLSQSLNANFMTKDNPAFKDYQKEFDRCVNDITRNLIKGFRSKMLGMNEASILAHIKDLAVNASSSYEMAAAGIILNLAYGKADKTLSELKADREFSSRKIERETERLLKEKQRLSEKFDRTNDEEKKAEILDAIRQADEDLEQIGEEYDRTLELEEEIQNARNAKELRDMQAASEIGGILNEPYFGELIQNYVSKAISKVANFELPASYQTLRPDLGVLSGDYKCAEEYARQMAGEENALEIKSLQKEIDSLREKYDSFRDKQEEFTGEEQEVVKALDAATEKIKDLRNYTKTDEFKAKVEKQMSEWFDENMHIKEGYCMLSREYASEFNVKPGDSVIHAVVPSDGLHALGTSKVIGLLNGADHGAVVMNSEYIQTRLGKDFDIDTIYMLAKSSMISDENFRTMCQSIEGANKKYRQMVTDAYRRILKNKVIDIDGRKVIGSSLTETEIYSKPAQLALLQEFNGKRESVKLVNPLYHGQSLLDKYTKDGIGQTVNTRKLMTMFSQSGITSKMSIPYGPTFDLNGAHDGLFDTFLDLQAKTNAYVDAPTNENSLFFYEDPVKNFDKMYGTKLEDVANSVIKEKFGKDKKQEVKYRGNIDSKIRAVKDANEILFGYGIKFNKEDNLDDMEEERELPDTLKYIKTQQQILRLISEGRTDELLDFAEKKLAENPKKAKALDNSAYANAFSEYILNIKMEDPYANANMNMINQIDTSLIPETGVTKEELLKMTDNAKKAMEEELPEYRESLGRVKLEGTDSQGTDAMKDAVRNFYITKENGALHELKCRALALMTPTSQIVYNRDKLKKTDDYRNDIMQANSYAYPQFMKIILDNTFNEFQSEYVVLKSKDALGDSVSGRMTDKGFEFGKEDAMLIGHRGNEIFVQTFGRNGKLYEYTQKEIMEETDAVAKRIKETLTREGGLMEKPFNRYQISKFVNLRGRSVPIAKRTELTLELLNKEFPKFTDDEKTKFWLSVFGNGSQVCPTNFDSSNGSKEKMYELMSGVKDKMSKRMMYYHAQKFTEAANKISKPLSKVAKINTLIDEKASPEDLFMETGGDKMKESENETEKSVLFNSIRDMVLKSKQPGYGVWYFDPVNGGRFEVSSFEKMQTSVAYTTKKEGFINAPMCEASKILLSFEGMNEIQGQFDQAMNRVNRLIKSVVEKQANETGKSKKEIGKEICDKVNRMAETNAFNLKMKWDPFEGTQYFFDGEKVAKKDIHDRFGSDIADAAIELIELNSLKIPQLVERTVAYLDQEMENIPTGFKDWTSAKKLRERLQKDLDAMKAMEGKYIPHIFKTDVFKKAAEKDIYEERLKEAKDMGYSDKKAEKYAKKKTKETLTYMSVDRFGPSVNSFEMKRKIKSNDYITDTTAIHNEHYQSVIKVIKSTLACIQSMQYEHRAAMDNVPKEEIQAMKKWFANQVGDRTLHEEFREVKSLKSGDKVSFFIRDSKGEPMLIRGMVDKKNEKYIYLAVNPEVYESYLDSRIKKAEEISAKIGEKNNRPATLKQMRLLDELGYEGEKLTVSGANGKILELLKDLKNHKEEWGRHKIKSIYTTQYIGGEPKEVSGVMKNVYNMSTIPGRSNGLERLSRTKTAEEISAVLNTVLSGMFLGTRGGGMKNLYEGHWAAARDMDVASYYAHFNDAKSFYQQFKAYRDGQIDNLGFTPEEFKNTMRWSPEIKENEGEKVKKLIAMHAYNYCIKEGLLFEHNEKSATGEINGRHFERAVEWATKHFSKKEFINRVMSAYLYAAKAVAVDGETDPKVIKSIIEKGVARTQALYDGFNRSLNDNTQTGHLYYKFRQYPWFMKEMERLKSYQKGFQNNDENKVELKMTEVEIRKGVKIPVPMLKEWLAEKKKNTFRSVDPDINSKRAFEMWMDSIGMTLGNFVPGLSVGNPVNKLPVFALQFTWQVLFHYLKDGEWPSEWDMKDCLFTIASFFVGFVPTFTMQTLYTLALAPKRDDQDTYDRLLNVATTSRATKGALAYVDIGKTLLSNDKVGRFTQSRNTRAMAKLARVQFGFDTFPGSYDRYKNDEENRVKTQIPILRPAMKPWFKWPLNFVPGANTAESN